MVHQEPFLANTFERAQSVLAQRLLGLAFSRHRTLVDIYAGIPTVAHEPFKTHTPVGSRKIDAFLVPLANVYLLATFVNVGATEAVGLVPLSALAFERTKQVYAIGHGATVVQIHPAFVDVCEPMALVSRFSNSAVKEPRLAFTNDVVASETAFANTFVGADRVHALAVGLAVVLGAFEAFVDILNRESRTLKSRTQIEKAPTIPESIYQHISCSRGGCPFRTLLDTAPST